jgi:hypothetical protein
LVVILFLLGAVEVLSAQSITLPFEQSGPVVRTEGSLATHEAIGLALEVGYSIAGVLDFGLRFGADVVTEESSVTSDVGMYYGYAPLKQSDTVPISAQIYGCYTFRAEDSDFLDRNRLVHEGRGYRLAVAFVRDVFVSSALGVRIGGLAEYSNYLETTSVGFDATGFTGTAEVDYAEYPRVERRSGFVYGAYVGAVLRNERGGAFLVGASILADPYLAFRLRPDVQLLVGRGAR